MITLKDIRELESKLDFDPIGIEHIRENIDDYYHWLLDCAEDERAHANRAFLELGWTD